MDDVVGRHVAFVFQPLPSFDDDVLSYIASIVRENTDDRAECADILAGVLEAYLDEEDVELLLTPPSVAVSASGTSSDSPITRLAALLSAPVEHGDPSKAVDSAATADATTSGGAGTGDGCGSTGTDAGDGEPSTTGGGGDTAPSGGKVEESDEPSPADDDTLVDTLAPEPAFVEEVLTDALFHQSSVQSGVATPAAHIDGGDRRQQVCKYFVVGRCHRADCWYSHDLSLAVCTFWLQGRCTRGDDCMYVHANPDSVADEAPLQRGGHAREAATNASTLAASDAAFPELGVSHGGSGGGGASATGGPLQASSLAAGEDFGSKLKLQRLQVCRVALSASRLAVNGWRLRTGVHDALPGVCRRAMATAASVQATWLRRFGPTASWKPPHAGRWTLRWLHEARRLLNAVSASSLGRPVVGLWGRVGGGDQGRRR